MEVQPLFILGPCSAESREQVLVTARQLQEVCGSSFVYRAGVWKARTSPSTFQGAGDEALAWLQEVKQTLGLAIATEVATPEQAEKALAAGVDYLWIGARTSANPIAVQAIAERLRVTSYGLRGLLIKNPVNADAALWVGNIERLEQTGVPVMAVHRGCNHKPCWSMAHEIRTRRPDIPLLLDPSHMSGDARQVPALMVKITELGLDGAMVEIHCCPEQALSDAQQQITPAKFGHFIETIKGQTTDKTKEDKTLKWLRAEIDELDETLWETLAARMEVSQRIGTWKKAHHMAPLQPKRYTEILDRRQQWATKNGINTAFVQQLFDAIHAESLKRQKSD